MSYVIGGRPLAARLVAEMPPFVRQVVAALVERVPGDIRRRARLGCVSSSWWHRSPARVGRRPESSGRVRDRSQWHP
ncbi:hypothetical protein [Lentzea sp. CC55]|uniref:hypothetical protein n=1 Tax=Lentzea sp. CC55 TaxID=2884909 RepID=UPI001F452217|nr:hypothetical protein [Lentzea sp. CC55]MCG8924033.1 hypothetical protein [Lentzea sp. CC55]